MNSVRFIVKELIGLFIDDTLLAAGIAAVVAAAWFAKANGIPALAGAILVFGCVAILLASAVSEKKQRLVRMGPAPSHPDLPKSSG
ncbi:MAG: hypothetical protein WBX25_36135 [Rhodomicrobium sp.]